MNTNHVDPTSVGFRLARWYLAAVAILLLGIAASTIVTYASQALTGTDLVFRQEDMVGDGGIGPAPAEGEAPAPGEEPPAEPPDDAGGGVQYVDLASLALLLAGGIVAAAGAVALFRRSSLGVPLGLAASIVAGVVGLFPASVGIWAADYYAEVDLLQAVPFIAVSVMLVLAAVLCGVAIWRQRTALASA
jgi:hypothetical protein